MGRVAQRNFRCAVLLAVLHDGMNSVERGNLLRGPLGVTTGHDNAGAGPLALSAANVGAGIALGLGGNAAGVHDDDVRILRRDRLRAESFHCGGDGVPVRLIGAAAEIFHVETLHLASVTMAPRVRIRSGWSAFRIAY